MNATHAPCQAPLPRPLPQHMSHLPKHGLRRALKVRDEAGLQAVAQGGVDLRPHGGAQLGGERALQGRLRGAWGGGRIQEGRSAWSVGFGGRGGGRCGMQSPTAARRPCCPLLTRPACPARTCSGPPGTPISCSALRTAGTTMPLVACSVVRALSCSACRTPASTLACTCGRHSQRRRSVEPAGCRRFGWGWQQEASAQRHHRPGKLRSGR